MSDSSSEQETADPSHSRKRLHRPEKRAPNVAKKLLNTGQAYVTRATKQQIAAHSVVQPCNDGCFTKVTGPVINLLFREFWNRKF